MPAAIAIPAILGAAGVGASVYGANKASGAAKSAANQQQQATQQAQAFNQQAWQAQQQATAPYRQAGQQALGNLMAQYGSQTPQDFAARSAGYVNSARMNPFGQPFAPQQPQGQQAFNPMGGIAPQQPGGGMPERGLELGAQGGGMVTVQDDTGATRQVPQAQARLYAQRGFKVMG